MKKFLSILAELVIIMISFEVSEAVAGKLLNTTRWWAELLLYMAVYMSLQGLVWLAKRVWKAKVTKHADSKE